MGEETDSVTQTGGSISIGEACGPCMNATGEVHGQLPGAGMLEGDLLKEEKKNDKVEEEWAF